MSTSTRASVDDGFLANDPWKNYTPTSFPKQQMSVVNSAVPRQVEAPTETRFAKQDEQIAKLEHSVTQLQERLDKKETADGLFQKNIQKDIGAVKTEVATQIDIIGKHFESSIARALKKQDDQMSSGFAELKQMLRMANQPVAAKKAKVAPPQGAAASGDREESMENADPQL